MSTRSDSKQSSFHHPRPDHHPPGNPTESGKPVNKRSDAAPKPDDPTSESEAEDAEAVEISPNDAATTKPKRRFRLPRSGSDAKGPGELIVQWWGDHPRGRIAAVGAAVALVLLWLLPSIVALTPLLGMAVSRATADVQGNVTVRSASLGWFSPVVLRDVDVTDADHRPVVSVPEVKTERSLLGFLLDTRNLGSFQLTEPKLSVVVREDGSNLQDVLAKYLAKKDNEPVDVTMKVKDGTIELLDARTNRKWQIEKFQLDVSVPADGSRPTTIKTTGKVVDARQPGEFNVSLSWGQAPAAGGNVADSVAVDEMTLKADGLSLAMFEPLLARWLPGAQAAGRVWANIDYRWDGREPGGKAVITGSLGGDDLQLTARALGSDRPKLAKLRAKGKLIGTAGVWQFEGVSAESDVGTIKIDGTMDLGAVGAGADADGSRRRTLSLLKQQFDATGQLDLAGLAAMLPNTLRLRKETRITAGKVEFALSSRAERDGMNWRGEIKATDLAAVNAGETIRRPEPIRVEFAVRDTPDGLAVDKLECKSNFLIVRASGTRQKGSADVDFNLDKLIQDAGGLLDLGSVKIAGEGLARASWNRQSDGRFDASGKFQVDRFQWFVPQRFDWSEKHLTGTLAAAGRIGASGDRRLDRLDVNIETAGEVTKLNLIEPVVNFNDKRPLKFELYSRGQLARWQSRTSPWVGSTGWKLAGDYELRSKANYSASLAEMLDAKLVVTKLNVEGPSLRIAEPKVDLSWTGRVLLPQRRVEVDLAKLLSDNFVAQLDKFSLAMPEKEPISMSGRLYTEMYVQRLSEWLGDASDWRFQGKLVHRLEIRQDGQGVSAGFEIRGDNLVATHRLGQRHEGNIVLTGAGATDILDHTFRLEQVTLKSRTAKDELVQGSLTGKIGWANSRPDIQLQGTLDPNMSEVTKLLQARFGPAIRVTGRSSNPFEYRGPLVSDKSVGSAAFRWDTAEFYGFQLGPAEVKADYSAGIVRINPLVFIANEGRVQLTPSVRLVPSPSLLTVQPGRVIEQVRIHPAMCAAALQYVSPLLANVATAEGRFSIDLEGCQIPMATPSRGEVAGKFVVHDIQISPGPNHLIHEIAKLIGRAAPARLKRESVVQFRMTGGRVYHDQMELMFSDITIRTKGSVGIDDQSLAILVEMPIPAKWQSNPLAARLFKNGITVPVGGTLSSPRIDPNAVEQIIRQTFEKAALDARNTAQQQLQQQMQQQLQQQFNRVLPPAGTAPAGTAPAKTAPLRPSVSPSLLKLKR